jgi:hypothetical protein
MGFSGFVLATTAMADTLDDNSVGENSNTAFITALAGSIAADPIADFAIDIYALGYAVGSYNGVGQIFYGEPIKKKK